jgi:hypothetical protein
MEKTERDFIEEVDIDFCEWKKGIQYSMPEVPVASNENDVSATAPTIADAEERTEGKALYDSAKASLNGWEVDINGHMAELANLKAGDKHESVYEALRDVVFFACWAMDNPEAARDSFNEWEEHKPERQNTNPYTQPVNMIFANAGVSLDSITAKRCEWAKIAAYAHPIAKKGMVNKGNFIKLVKSHGGIHGLYKRVTSSTKKPSGQKSGGGMGISGAEADAKIAAGLENLHQALKGENRNYVVVLLDANQGKNGKPAKNPKSPKALVNHLSAMNEFIVAWNATDDEAQEIMDIYREDEVLDGDAQQEEEALSVSGGGDA